MFFVAYQRMYAKPGNMTPGTDGKTEDEMSIDRINKLIESIKDETYSPNPAKRIYIPKKEWEDASVRNTVFEDKLVQEVVRMVLEAIYEGHFEWTSHGFRPNRSCHTALKSLQNNFNGAKWFIEGRYKGFFWQHRPWCADRNNERQNSRWQISSSDNGNSSMQGTWKSGNSTRLIQGHRKVVS